MYALQKGLKYCGRTGTFYRHGNAVGKINRGGYVRFRYLGEVVSAHRLAFLAMLGRWPEGDVDHKNGVRHDNRWRNLREGSTNQNMQNQRIPHSNNKSGYLGVSWKHGRWKAQIRVDGVVIVVGRFTDPAEAHKAYLKAKRKHHEGCMI